MLSWACSIHKAQGATLDAVAVDISRCFTAGHAYVALSRVRAAADIIFLKDFEEYVVNCDTSSLEAYKVMRRELVSDFHEE